MPKPVVGVMVDEEEQILYAAEKNGNQLFTYDLIAEKALRNIEVGYGPSELALARSLNQLFVANRFSNDISVVDLKKRKETMRINAGREPVALAISPDESLLVVANLLPEQPSTSKHVASRISLIDINEARVIKQLDLLNGSYSVKDIIFSNDGKWIYTTHLLGRYNLPTNQIEKGWINTNALSIIDVNERELYTTVLLDDLYKGAANPRGLDISEDGNKLFVAISSTHELMVIDRIAMHQQIESTKQVSQSGQTTYNIAESAEDKGTVYQASNQLEPMRIVFEEIPHELSFLRPVRQRIKLKGKGPAHVAEISGRAYVSSYFSDGLEIVDLNTEPSVSTFVKLAAKDNHSSLKRRGELLFHDAESCFQQWQSCASCHPGDARVDGLNWDLLNDGIGNPKNTKSLLFSHETPPTAAMGVRENAEASVRAGFKHIQFFDIPEEDAVAVDAYLKSIRPISSPHLENGKLSRSATRGENIFIQNGCNHCHSGPYYTNLQQYEFGHPAGSDHKITLDTPTLVELWRTAPYLHDGSYYQLEDVFIVGNHGLDKPLSAEDVSDLTAYLLSL